MSNLFDKKDVFSWSNCEEARQYIGEEGYFCDECREDLAAWHKGLLQDVDLSMTVDCIFENEKNEVFGLFLPADKVKQPEPKKWRPFKYMDEFSYHIFMTKNFHSISHTITVEDQETSIRYRLTIIGEFEKGLVLPIYGALTFQELFECLKIYNENHQIGWQPFGVEE